MVNETLTHRREGGFVGRTPASRPSWTLWRRRACDPTRTFRFVFPNWRVGQKNYLFIGSEGAAKAAAIAFTPIETAKPNSVERPAGASAQAGDS